MFDRICWSAFVRPHVRPHFGPHLFDRMFDRICSTASLGPPVWPDAILESLQLSVAFPTLKTRTVAVDRHRGPHSQTVKWPEPIDSILNIDEPPEGRPKSGRSRQDRRQRDNLRPNLFGVLGSA
jgi:hypothetical protein